MTKKDGKRMLHNKLSRARPTIASTHLDVDAHERRQSIQQASFRNLRVDIEPHYRDDFKYRRNAVCTRNNTNSCRDVQNGHWPQRYTTVDRPQKRNGLLRTCHKASFQSLRTHVLLRTVWYWLIGVALE